MDLKDFAVLAKQWQLRLLWDIAPAGGDGIVNLLDFAAFANAWTGSPEDLTNLAAFASQWLQPNTDIAPAPSASARL